MIVNNNLSTRAFLNNSHKLYLFNEHFCQGQDWEFIHKVSFHSFLSLDGWRNPCPKNSCRYVNLENSL